MLLVLLFAAAAWGLGKALGVPARQRWYAVGGVWLAALLINVLLPEAHPLRAATGLGAFPEEATRHALSNTLHAVWLRHEGTLIGMARLIGDGACFAQVTDVAVHPDHQGQGHGHTLMTELMRWADTHLPHAYISLIADPGAERLYAKHGFSSRTGMARPAR